MNFGHTEECVKEYRPLPSLLFAKQVANKMAGCWSKALSGHKVANVCDGIQMVNKDGVSLPGPSEREELCEAVLLAYSQQLSIWRRNMLKLLEFCFMFTSYMSWQINYTSFVILHPDHTSSSNVFELRLPGSLGILIVVLHQHLSVGRGWGVEHLFA